jgi:prepilin-type N-terminal cleavage/methylation domain-containing protein
MSLSDRRGFTLIEIVIVMAIAALMLLVVFNAVGNAQRNNRDNTRKQEAGEVVAILEQYATNHNGRYPTDLTDAALPNYDSKQLVSGANFKYSNAACPATVTSSTYNVVYSPQGSAGNYRDYNLDVCLEGTNGALRIHP